MTVIKNVLLCVSLVFALSSNANADLKKDAQCKVFGAYEDTDKVWYNCEMSDSDIELEMQYKKDQIDQEYESESEHQEDLLYNMDEPENEYLEDQNNKEDYID